jgi:hypothetical protein
MSGPVGPTGEVGRIQPFPVQSESQTVENPPVGSVFDHTVDCPAGYVVISGGFNVSGDMTSGAPRTLVSAPASTASWRSGVITVANHDSISFYTTAICALS